MSAPYRETSCAVCGEPSPHTVECARCGKIVCHGCMRRGACGACVDAALELVLRNLREGRREPAREPPNWLWPLRFVAVALVGAAAMTTVRGALVAAPDGAWSRVGAPARAPVGGAWLAGSALEDRDGPATHDPYTLFDRAAALGERGEVTLARIRLDPALVATRAWEREVGANLARGPLATPRFPDGTVGLRLLAVEPDGFLARIGLRPGDIVTSFDGYDVATLPNELDDEDHLAVVEVLRGTRRIVLVVSWASSP